MGTSSQRRLAQLKALRGDVVVKDLRGNVDTRIRKLDEGQYDALILASAGLVAARFARSNQCRIPISQMLPAVGQGAIAIETRSDDDFRNRDYTKLDHRETVWRVWRSGRSCGAWGRLPVTDRRTRTFWKGSC